MALDLNDICKQAKKVVEETGEYILTESKQLSSINIEEKSKNSLVSKVDKNAEEKLVKALAEILPEAGFLTEEETTQNEIKELTWIIDPLDGTTNFLYGIPAFCVSVALQIREELVIGITYELGQKEMFYAAKDLGAYCNDQPIKVSGRDDIEKTLLATGFPYYDFSKSEAYFEMIHHLINKTRGIRRIGSAALDMAYVACGRFDGFFEYSLKPWDVAAGAVLIQEAGGKISDFSGTENYLHGGELICGNPPIQKVLLETAHRFFKPE